MGEQTREMRRIAWFDMLFSLSADIDAHSIEIDTSILGISSSLAAPSRVSRVAVVRRQKLQAHSKENQGVQEVGLIKGSC